MIIAFSEILSAEFKDHSCDPVSIRDIRVDSATGKILGFLSDTGFYPTENVLMKESGIEWGNTSSLKNDGGDSWMRFRVVNRKNRTRGRVTELWFDSPSFCIVKFEAEKSFFGYFPMKRIYASEDIFEVIPQKRIIVVEEENRSFQGKSVPAFCS